MTPNRHTPADPTAANEQAFNLGVPDYSVAFEVAEFEAEQEAEDEKWEREGRAEMNYMLGLTDY